MNVRELIKEVVLKAIRSSGSGGQHVNKVATKIELQFSIPNSTVLSSLQKQLLLEKLASRLTKKGILILQCDEKRSQLQNKNLVIKRFKELITEQLKQPKVRKPTTTPRSVIKKRMDEKKKQSEKKASRKKPDLD